MEVNTASTTNPETAVSSTRIREEQAVEEERKRGEARPENAQADPGPSVGKVVDITV